MSGTRSRRKGHNFERELANIFKARFPGLDIKRGLGQTRCGSECADVEMPDFWIEAKRGKRTNVKAALEQAIEASLSSKKIPVAVCRDDGKIQPTVTMLLTDFMKLLEDHFENSSENSSNVVSSVL
jgi:hypothetical protein